MLQTNYLLRSYDDIASIFLRAGQASGWLTAPEYEELLARVQALQEKCADRHGKHALIFVTSLREDFDMTMIHQRIIQRAQPGDKAVTLPYLRLLEQLYQQFFDAFEGPKIRVVNNEDKTDAVLKEIIDFLLTL